MKKLLVVVLLSFVSSDAFSEGSLGRGSSIPADDQIEDAYSDSFCLECCRELDWGYRFCLKQCETTKECPF